MVATVRMTRAALAGDMGTTPKNGAPIVSCIAARATVMSMLLRFCAQKRTKVQRAWTTLRTTVATKARRAALAPGSPASSALRGGGGR
jgi:hypothetical protein